MRDSLFGLTLVVWVGVGCQNVAERNAAIEGQEASVADHGLEVPVSPPRNEVPADGPLEVEISVRNLSDSVVQFRPIFNFGAWLDAEILDRSGSPIQKTASIDPPNAWAVSLRTGESIADTVDLRCSLQVPAGIPCTAPYDLSRPGTYQVKMHFTLPCDIEGCDEFIKVEAKSFTVKVGDEGD